MRISHYWQSAVIMTRQLYQWTPQTVFCLSRGRSGFAPRTGRIIRCKILALYITDCVSLCLSDETLKAVGPFYLVYMPGEVKYPTSLHWRYVILSGILCKLRYNDAFFFLLKAIDKIANNQSKTMQVLRTIMTDPNITTMPCWCWHTVQRKLFSWIW